MLELQQSDGGLITHYTVHKKRPAEAPLLAQAIARHKAIFGCVPEVCAADKGFYSQAAVAQAAKLGVDTLDRAIAIVSLRYLLMRRLGENRLLRRLNDPDLAAMESGPWSAVESNFAG